MHVNTGHGIGQRGQTASEVVLALDPSLLPFCRSLLDLFAPPSRLPLSTWAERNLVLSPEYAARSTNLSLFGWQREIFDAFTDPSVTDVVLMMSTQLTKTIFIQAAMAYVMVEDPGPILLVSPTDTDAKDFSRERLDPMIRDCVCLHGKVTSGHHTDVGGSGKASRLQGKYFPGGSLSLVGAGAPGNLARRTIRYLFCDEVDKYKLDIREEGDPINLAWERTATFGSRKKRILCCTPTVMGRSRIGKAFKGSDQRRPYVPCWKCGFFQPLRFFPGEGGPKGGGYVWFDASLAKERQATTAQYVCENCQIHWTDMQRQRSCEKAEWRASAPFNGTAGFWISHLYSPWKKLSDVVQTFLDTKDDRTTYKTFINTNLAIEWAEDGETPDHARLFARRESYSYGREGVIPSHGLFLTAAVDVQESPPRLEVEVRAWGRGRENWSICYEIIQCFAQNGEVLPVTSPELWQKLDQDILRHNWVHESGHTLPIMAMAVDTGRRPKPVYEFARTHTQLSYSPGVGVRIRSPRTVVPIKGTPDQYRVLSSVSGEDATRRQQGVRILGVGTHCAKQMIYDALRHVQPKTVPPSPNDPPVPGLYHFPMYDMPHFTGLCSEVLVVKENGKAVYEQRNPRNEQIDIAVYQLAMAMVVGIDRFTEAQWRQMEEALKPIDKPSVENVIESVVSLGGGTERSLLLNLSVTSSQARVSVHAGEEAVPHTASPPVPQPAVRPISPAYPPVVGPSRRIRGRFSLD